MKAFWEMNKKRKIACAVLAVLIVATLCFIFGNSLKGPDESKAISDKAGELLRPIVDPDKSMTDEEYSFFIRKSGHFVEYTALGIECALLVLVVCGRITALGTLASAFFCLLMADVDEFIQSFTDRGSKVSDVLLDFSGALTGIILGFAAVYAVKSVKKRIKNRGKKAS